MRPLIRFCLMLYLVSLSFRGAGQTSANLSAGGNGLIGNYRAIGLSVTGEVTHKTDSSNWTVSPSYQWSRLSDYGSSRTKLYQSEFYLTASASKRIGRLKIISFTEDESSYTRSILIRSSAGIGLGGLILNREHIELSASNAILPEYYRSSETAKNDVVIRNSVRAKLVISVGNLEIKSITLYQPAVASTRKVGYSDNLNVRSTNSVSIKINRDWSFGLQHVYSYQGYPHYLNGSVKRINQTFYLNLIREIN